ncbi:hypothetical protein DFJ74DRAFT_703211 [Hyaloraphidium curvatum]|nr:hypothetical protein DFJ74DRAFT_703211 [Hyaloraphidium curvatum]
MEANRTPRDAAVQTVPVTQIDRELLVVCGAEDAGWPDETPGGPWAECRLACTVRLDYLGLKPRTGDEELDVEQLDLLPVVAGAPHVQVAFEVLANGRSHTEVAERFGNSLLLRKLTTGAAEWDWLFFLGYSLEPDPLEEARKRIGPASAGGTAFYKLVQPKASTSASSASDRGVPRAASNSYGVLSRITFCFDFAGRSTATKTISARIAQMGEDADSTIKVPQLSGEDEQDPDEVEMLTTSIVEGLRLAARRSFLAADEAKDTNSLRNELDQRIREQANVARTLADQEAVASEVSEGASASADGASENDHDPIDELAEGALDGSDGSDHEGSEDPGRESGRTSLTDGMFSLPPSPRSEPAELDRALDDDAMMEASFLVPSADHSFLLDPGDGSLSQNGNGVSAGTQTALDGFEALWTSTPGFELEPPTLRAAEAFAGATSAGALDSMFDDHEPEPAPSGAAESPMMEWEADVGPGEGHLKSDDFGW